MQFAAVILAAGASTRFGSAKQVARIGAKSLLETVVGLAAKAGLRPVIAVVPSGMSIPAGVIRVPNDAPADGLSRSLRLGLEAVPPESHGALVLLGDQPTLEVAAIRSVLAAARPERPIVAARADGRLAPPVLLLRAAFGLAHEARGDEGLRSVLDRCPELVTTVEVREHPPDVDTVDDLRRVARIAHMFDSSGGR